MLSTMQDVPLSIRLLFEHGKAVYGNSEVITATADGVKRATFTQLADRVARLASALRQLGVRESDRVGTFAWNTQEHMEAYLAIPCMGAVLHTVNIRLFAEQMAYVINHASDRVLIVEDNLIPALAPIVAQLTGVEHIVVVGDGDSSALGRPSLRYEDLLAEAEPQFEWPHVDERSAAAMCYTSGTTGNPKGVTYSQRSMVLHSYSLASGETFGLSARDTVLPVVPMFHANAWGLPYASWMVGTDLVLPGRFARPDRLAEMIRSEKVTVGAAVPTVWFDLMTYSEKEPVDLSSMRMVMSGGSAVPAPLIEAYKNRFGVELIQGWGLTETSPLASMAFMPKRTDQADEMYYRASAGRPATGVEMRLIGADGQELPWDGKAVGEVEVRGPWVTQGYNQDPSPEKFHDGWLRTGDVGSVDSLGFIHITDRAKDVVKSGGEWISTLELEAAILTHPAVREVAVVALPDERWSERPLACVVLKEGASATPEELRENLTGRVARWWIPEAWCFIDAVPRTSVGKFDKKVLRASQAAGEITLHRVVAQPVQV